MMPSAARAVRIRALLLASGLALAAVPVLALPVTAQQPQSSQSQQETERRALVADLDSIARAPVLRGQVVGSSVIVVRGRDTLLHEAYGLGSVELHVPTPRDAVYEIGSVTKQFTAAALLQLVEQGSVELDAPITRYLPDYPTDGRTITVRRLLDHTSGIQGYTEMPAFGTIATRALPRDSLVAMFAAEPLNFEPGSAMIYNNSAYFLAGLIIEKASGRSYEEYVDQEIFDKLGMRHSAYCSNQTVLRNKVTGYARTPDGRVVQGGFIHHNWPYAAGSLCSSAGDMITWLRALHHGGVLSPAMYREMTSPASLADGTPLRYGLGVSVGSDATGQRAIAHGGGIPGYLSDTRYYPEHDLYIVVLQNSAAPPGPGAVAQALAERILGRAPEPAAVPLRNADPYVGEYHGPVRGRQDAVAHIARDGDGLTMRMNDGPPNPIRHVGNDTFRAGNQILTFRREGGRVVELRIDSGGGLAVLRRR
jgi:CubicO group peptidase (beta-lactamase class C family)